MNKVLTLVIILAALPACKSTKTSETTKTTDVNVVETAVKQNITQNNESRHHLTHDVMHKNNMNHRY